MVAKLYLTLCSIKTLKMANGRLIKSIPRNANYANCIKCMKWALHKKQVRNIICTKIRNFAQKLVLFRKRRKMICSKIRKMWAYTKRTNDFWGIYSHKKLSSFNPIVMIFYNQKRNVFEF